jgi:septum formation protein
VATPPVILASTSPYRRELLARLRIPFEILSPGIDETPQRNEVPADLALRLAREKARVVAARRLDALVIGADQVAVLDGRILAKPGTHANAVAQLRAARGQRMSFITAVAVAQGAREESRAVPCQVEFQSFSDRAIEAYLAAEKPYDCAGAAKIEGLGIALVRGVECADPTAIIGLPLIALCELLRAFGYDVLGDIQSPP